MRLKTTGKSKEIRTMIPFPPYKYRVYVIFTDSLEGTAENLVNEGKLSKNHDIDDTCGAFHVRMPNQPNSYIVLRYDARVGHIVHESYHCICTMFKWVGAEQEEELFAYHLDYLVDEIIKDQEKVKKVLDKVEKV